MTLDTSTKDLFEHALAKAQNADPADAPFPLTPSQAKLWHEAQASALQWVLEMLPAGELGGESTPEPPSVLIAWLEAEPTATVATLATHAALPMHSAQVHIGADRPADRPQRNKWFPLYTGTETRQLPHDMERLDALGEHSWDLRCFDTADGEDIGWRVIEHHMAEPNERVVAEVFEDNPRAAIDAAIARLKMSKPAD